MTVKYSDFVEYMSDLKACIKKNYDQHIFDTVLRCMNYDHSDLGFRLYFECDPDTILFLNFYFCEKDELTDQDIKAGVITWLFYCAKAYIWSRLDF